jgi:hypothetical protein
VSSVSAAAGAPFTSASTARRVVTTHVPAAATGAAPAAPAAAAPSPPAPPAGLFPAPAPPRRGVAGALQTARSYSLLLVLAGAVVAFLALQGRLDRRDPRIAHAPTGNRLEFRDFE